MNKYIILLLLFILRAYKVYFDLAGVRNKEIDTK